MCENVPLAPLTTLEVGGPARYFVELKDRDQLSSVLAWARAHHHPVLMLGDGSNVLVADSGFDGLVIRLTGQRLQVKECGNEVRVEADAGVVWDELVSLCVEHGWAGVECLSGIPGRVGAAPIQNIGAYGQQLSDVLTEVQVVEYDSGASVKLEASACGLGYRTSRFKRHPSIIAGIEIALLRGALATVRYADLRRRLGPRAVSLAEVREAVLDIRRDKSMVIDARDPNHRSAGSFFINPLVDARRAEQVGARLGVEVPGHEVSGGCVKIPAAWLIEQCGFGRGWHAGPAGLSTRHTLAIVNRGEARAVDILEVARAVRRGVAESTGIWLAPEPVLVGFSVPADELLR
jgi:UDP-N-acetylmuramate dehydrogenase